MLLHKLFTVEFWCSNFFIVSFLNSSGFSCPRHFLKTQLLKVTIKAPNTLWYDTKPKLKFICFLGFILMAIRNSLSLSNRALNLHYKPLLFPPHRIISIIPLVYEQIKISQHFNLCVEGAFLSVLVQRISRGGDLLWLQSKCVCDNCLTNYWLYISVHVCGEFSLFRELATGEYRW